MEKRPPQTKGLRSAREFSAGGTVYKNLNSKILWLVTKSTPSELYPISYWRLPKGWLDDENKGKDPGPLGSGKQKASEQDIRKAAAREVAEEGGVKVKIIKKIGSERIFYTKANKKVLKFVTYYLMGWVADIPQGPGFETKEVAWLPYEDAREKLKYPGEKKILDKANEILVSGLQENLI